jgi:putative ABC transport system permease protein
VTAELLRKANRLIRNLKVASLLAFTSIIRGNAGVILLTILILVLVAMNLLFVPSLLNGLVRSSDDKVKDTYVGDIVVEPAVEKELLRDAGDLVSKIESIDGVVAATPRSNMGAEIEFEDEQVRCTVFGISPEREKNVFTIHEWLTEGSYLDSRDGDEILLGIQLAGAEEPDLEFYPQSLQKVHVGDKVLVTYVNGIGKKYSVKGIFYTKHISTDLQAFVSEREFMSINSMSRNRANSIHVKLVDNINVDSVIKKISGIRDELKVFSWEDYAGIVRSMTDSFNVIKAILNVTNVLVASFTVFIVTYIDVASRKRQIGIQRAIGITPSSITLSYLIRAIFYAITSFILASLIFVNIVIPLQIRHPFHFPFGEVYLLIGPSDMIQTALILLGVSFVSSLIPVRGIIRIKILDAIWG